MMTLIEFLIHFVTFIAIFIPLFILWKIYSKSKEEFAKKLFIPAIGLIPVAIVHILELATYFDIKLLDPYIELIEHVTILFLFITYAYFLYWFKKSYVDPIYGK